MYLTDLCGMEEASPALALATFQQTRVFRAVQGRDRGREVSRGYCAEAGCGCVRFLKPL